MKGLDHLCNLAASSVVVEELVVFVVGKDFDFHYLKFSMFLFCMTFELFNDLNCYKYFS